MRMHAGAAWRSILEALGVAAGDHSVQVVSGALVALQQVIDLLFQVGPLPVLVAFPFSCEHRRRKCKHLTVLMSLRSSASAVSFCRSPRQISAALSALCCVILFRIQSSLATG